MPGRALALVSLLPLSACGDDGPGGSPDRPDASVGVTCSASIHAAFEVYASPQYSDLAGAYDDVPSPSAFEEKVREGECAFFAPEPPFCDQVCGQEALCSVGGVCRPFPRHIDIGAIRLTGTDPDVVLEASDDGSYQSEIRLPSLYQPGDHITLTAGGEDGIPAIALAVRGVTPLPEQQLVIAREHEDLVITWEPDPRASEGTELIFHADQNHHGGDPYIECRGPDDGELVVPAAVLDELILLDPTRIQVDNAWLRRINQASVETDRGCLTFQSFWEVLAWIEIIRAE